MRIITIPKHIDKSGFYEGVKGRELVLASFYYALNTT